jgi:hypothetical protein
MMPIGDWQFWVVTVAAVVGLAAVYRQLRPRGSGGRGGAARGPKVDLTVERRSPRH